MAVLSVLAAIHYHGFSDIICSSKSEKLNKLIFFVLYYTYFKIDKISFKIHAMLEFFSYSFELNTQTHNFKVNINNIE